MLRLRVRELAAVSHLASLHNDDVTMGSIAEHLRMVLPPIEGEQQVARAAVFEDRNDLWMRNIRSVGRLQEAQHAHGEVVDRVSTLGTIACQKMPLLPDPLQNCAFGLSRGSIRSDSGEPVEPTAPVAMREGRAKLEPASGILFLALHEGDIPALANVRDRGVPGAEARRQE